ncbi:MAG: copper homeostasis protein [Flavobacteriales bacterium]|jgi:copper homeostasis protein
MSKFLIPMQIELCLFSSFNLPVLHKSIRIELCSDFFQGGLSPNYSSFIKCRAYYTNPLFVMIRPRGGDFCYSNEEFELMKTEISWFKDNGADGIVLGLLHMDGSIDKKRTSELVQLASPLPVTFHRAFDMSVDLDLALEDVIYTGCTRILSSGGASNVELGFNKLVKLHQQTKGRIEIMPGGGVTIDNVQGFIDAGFKNIHLSSKKLVKSKMQFRANLSMTANPNISSFDYIGVDFEKLKQFTAYVRENETY